MPKYIVYSSNTQSNANNIDQANKRDDVLLATGKQDIGNFFLSPICSIKANIVTGPAAVAQDRFAPGEAYHATIYKLKKQKKEQAAANSAGYNYEPPAESNPDLGPVFISTTPPSPTVPTKQSDLPKPNDDSNIYNFPPNIDSSYSTPPHTLQTSYLPPASGQPDVMYDDQFEPSHPSSYFPTGYDHPRYNWDGFSGVDSYPEVIVDHDPHFHEHHPVYHPHMASTIEASTTQKAVMEKEKNEPRAKTYSYYYLGRKVWYIPLFFTLYFCIYVAALIIRSIGRHKVS
jgi:hypothetical protein